MADKFEFADFILSMPHEQVDDRGVSIESDIPNKFVMALVPLGKYEWEKFREKVG